MKYAKFIMIAIFLMLSKEVSADVDNKKDFNTFFENFVFGLTQLKLGEKYEGAEKGKRKIFGDLISLNAPSDNLYEEDAFIIIDNKKTMRLISIDIPIKKVIKYKDLNCENIQEEHIHFFKKKYNVDFKRKIDNGFYIDTDSLSFNDDNITFLINCSKMSFMNERIGFTLFNDNLFRRKDNPIDYIKRNKELLDEYNKNK